MTKNLTLKVDEELLARARHLAVDERKSLSAWVAELIEEALKERARYEESRIGAMRVLDQGFHLGGKPLSRDSIYER